LKGDYIGGFFGAVGLALAGFIIGGLAGIPVQLVVCICTAGMSTEFSPTMTICAVIGALIGFVYGLTQLFDSISADKEAEEERIQQEISARRAEEDRKRREEQARKSRAAAERESKRKEQCRSNAGAVKKNLASVAKNCSEQLAKILAVDITDYPKPEDKYAQFLYTAVIAETFDYKDTSNWDLPDLCNKLKENYTHTADELVTTLKEIDEMLASNGTKNYDKILSVLRSQLKEERRLKKMLISAKALELKYGAESDKKRFKKLGKKWTIELTLLSLVFFDKDSPFVFEWAYKGEDWIDKIYGIKDELPAESKEFIFDMIKCFERSKTEVSDIV